MQTSHGPAAAGGPRHHVLIIGSGFGGLFAAKALAHEHVRVTVLASTGYHLFQPLLYQVATGVLSVGEVAPATREVLRRQRNARVLLGTVTDIDLAGRTVVSRSPAGTLRTSYDSLIVAAGSSQSYFGRDEFAVFAPGMKTIDDALELRGRIFGAFELAEVRAQDPTTTVEELRALLTFVVVGAGPTGVEMAGQIAELAHRALRDNFRSINPAHVRIVLADFAEAVLGPFDPQLRDRAAAHLESMGVELLLGRRVVGVDRGGVDLQEPDGSVARIDTRTKIWAAGVQASPLGATLAEQTGAETDRAGRIRVEADCTLPGRPEVFVVGDMMSIDGVPGLAQAAMQSAEHAADQIGRRLRGKPVGQPFNYHDKGSMAIVSRFYAVAELGERKVWGLPAWALWLGVHLVYLIGFKNRLTTLLHWAVSFVGSGRSERTATHQQVIARTVMLERQRDDQGPPAVH